MKVNGEKFQLTFFSNANSTSITIKINNELIDGSPEETYLELY